MNRILITILIYMLGFSQKSASQNIDTVISKIFFSAELSKQAPSLLEYYGNLSSLTLAEDSLYPLIYFHGGEMYFKSYVYEFTKHSFLPFDFKKGIMRCTTSKGGINIQVFNPQITFFFNSDSTQENAFHYLQNLMAKYESKKSEFNDSACSIQATQFSNAGKYGNLRINKFSNDLVKIIYMFYSLH